MHRSHASNEPRSRPDLCEFISVSPPMPVAAEFGGAEVSNTPERTRRAPLRVLAGRAPGGPSKAEPGAAPGRGGAQRSRLDSHTRPDSAVGPRLRSSECPFEKPTVLQTAPLYPSGSLGRMNRFRMKRPLVALLLRSDSKQDARLQIQAGRRGTVGRGEIDDPAAETAYRARDVRGDGGQVVGVHREALACQGVGRVRDV